MKFLDLDLILGFFSGLFWVGFGVFHLVPKLQSNLKSKNFLLLNS